VATEFCCHAAKVGWPTEEYWQNSAAHLRLFLKAQLARMPTRAWLSRMWLIGFGSLWALFAVAMMLLLAR
jgi:hypothetical protein